jgi:hypothetical protein
MSHIIDFVYDRVHFILIQLVEIVFHDGMVMMLIMFYLFFHNFGKDYLEIGILFKILMMIV